MYKTKKRAFSVIVYAASAVLYILFTLFLLMQSKNKSSLTINLGLPAVMFIAFLVISVSLGKFIDRHLYLKSIVKSDTKYLVDFIDRLRF